jgi:hypothetical protein
VPVSGEVASSSPARFAPWKKKLGFLMRDKNLVVNRCGCGTCGVCRVFRRRVSVISAYSFGARVH